MPAYTFFGKALHTEEQAVYAVYTSSDRTSAEFIVMPAEPVLAVIEVDAGPAANWPTLKGFYEHYKKKPYEVLGLAIDPKSREELVLYQPIYETNYDYFLRPKAMFQGNLDDGTQRFKKVRTLSFG